ncbi:hypothetical protein [Brachyspira sp.]|uniref:hypothetical protein n=1 Tax=Brachyspira sp. TaxID=1977261 RepID=UPI003D7E7C24
MKLANFFIILFILILSFTSCKKTTVTITKPGEDISLTDIFGKIEDGTYGNLKISNGGQNMTIGGTNYTNNGDIGGFVGIYENSTNSNDNMLVIQGAGATITVPANKKGTEAVKNAFEKLGEDRATFYISEAIKPENQKDDGSVDTDKLLKMATKDEEDKLKEIFSGNNITFGKFETYK